MVYEIYALKFVPKQSRASRRYLAPGQVFEVVLLLPPPESLPEVAQLALELLVPRSDRELGLQFSLATLRPDADEGQKMRFGFGGFGVGS